MALFERGCPTPYAALTTATTIGRSEIIVSQIWELMICDFRFVSWNAPRQESDRTAFAAHVRQTQRGRRAQPFANRRARTDN